MKTRRITRSLVCLAIVANLLAAAFFGFVEVEKWRGEGAWRKYKAAAPQRGVKLDMANFIPPEVADAENFAAIPLFREAFAAEAAGQPLPNPFELPREFIHWGKSELKPPSLAEWHAQFRKARLIPEPSADHVADLRRALERFEPGLNQLRAASARPHAQFPIDWTNATSSRTAHFKILQSAADVLSVRVRMSLVAGSSDDALADWQLGMRLAQAMVHQPTMISGTRPYVLRRPFFQSARQGLAIHAWAEPEVRAIAAELNRIDLFDEYAFAVQSERGACNLMFENSIQMAQARRGWLFDRDQNERPFLISWVRWSQTRTNELCDEMLARASRNTGWMAPPSLSSLVSNEWRQANRLQQARLTLFSLRARSLLMVEVLWPEYHIEIEQARLGCALELCRMQRGEFPATLEELVPEFVFAVPLDPRSGQPIRYRRTATGYRLEAADSEGDEVRAWEIP